MNFELFRPIQSMNKYVRQNLQTTVWYQKLSPFRQKCSKQSWYMKIKNVSSAKYLIILFNLQLPISERLSSRNYWVSSWELACHYWWGSAKNIHSSKINLNFITVSRKMSPFMPVFINYHLSYVFRLKFYHLRKIT